jgi:hypothetical protein
MATLSLTLDKTDPIAIVGYIEQATAGWPQSKLDALSHDLGKLIKQDRVVEIDTTDGIMSAIVHRDVLDALLRHGLDPIY